MGQDMRARAAGDSAQRTLAVGGARTRRGAGIQFTTIATTLPADSWFSSILQARLARASWSKRLNSPYPSGAVAEDWLKMKKSGRAGAVKREAEEDWGKQRWR
jgi:hypothetical protein